MRSETKRVIFQVALFIATFITTTLAGCEWVYGKTIYSYDEKTGFGFNDAFTWEDFLSGMEFSIPLLLILTVHEFGHYFMAVYHRVKTSLPYYIPIPPIPLFFSFGTFGAVIRLREKPQSTKQTFDIGLAGPVAGFVVALLLLVYGFATLPPQEYVYQFHPEYEAYGPDYADHVYRTDNVKGDSGVLDLKIGKNLIFLVAEQFVSDRSRIPNPHELMHYPVLFAVFFALFVTSLNLFPIGQFDGGHVVYGLFGYKKHKIIATVFFLALIFYGGLGNPFVNLGLPADELLFNTALYILVLFFAFSALGMGRKNTLMYVMAMVAGQFLFMFIFPDINGYTGWLFLTIVFVKLMGIHHPPSEIEQPLDSRRILLGWFALLIFVLCFTPNPFEIQVISGK